MSLREANERRRLLSDERGNRMACPFTGPVIDTEVMGNSTSLLSSYESFGRRFCIVAKIEKSNHKSSFKLVAQVKRGIQKPYGTVKTAAEVTIRVSD